MPAITQRFSYNETARSRPKWPYIFSNAQGEWIRCGIKALPTKEHNLIVLDRLDENSVIQYAP